MKINELSKELGITNKDLITFLKGNGFKVSSHNQNATDEMEDLARLNFVKINAETLNDEDEDEVEVVKPVRPTVPKYQPKVFAPDDLIPCRSVTPWAVDAVGVDKTTVYHWDGFGDVDYLRYRDLQGLRRSDYVRKPLIIIEDADLCEQWKRELGDVYKHYLGVEYPEEFFDKDDKEFEKLLGSDKTPYALKETIKFTALNMIRNENYPALSKVIIIDKVLGTCLKDFI